jgi:hypothetical protein
MWGVHVNSELDQFADHEFVTTYSGASEWSPTIIIVMHIRKFKHLQEGRDRGFISFL